MSMTHPFEINFNVYLDDNFMETNSRLTGLCTVVHAFDYTAAENIIKAQYNNRVYITGIKKLD